MNFVIKLFVLVILLSLVQPRKTIKVWKSIKMNEKMVYDCVDIYKQPSLSHPLLQNHTIQMKPSFAISKSNKQIKQNYRKTVECPHGTVPILRNSKDNTTNSQHFEEKYLNPLTIDSTGTHVADVILQGRSYRGIASTLSVHDMNISKDQASYARIYVGNAMNNKVNSIQTGWMVNPSVFGDSRTWGYGFWKGTNGIGCCLCPGFVQVSKTDPLFGLVAQGPEGKRNFAIAIHQDKISGHWWRTDMKYNKPDIYIGYWPKELFDTLGNGVDLIGVGGAVQASPSGISPPMGNGHLPTGNDMESARVGTILFKDSSFKFRSVGEGSKLDYLLDNKNCYGLKAGKNVLFTFGGPGGNCGM